MPYDRFLFDECPYDGSPEPPAELPGSIRLAIGAVFAISLQCGAPSEIAMDCAAVFPVDVDRAADTVTLEMAAPTRLVADETAPVHISIGFEEVHP